MNQLELWGDAGVSLSMSNNGHHKGNMGQPPTSTPTANATLTLAATASLVT